MKIKAYLLYDHAVIIQPAAKERDWIAEDEERYESLALDTAHDQGWELLCPTAFEATWNGGPNPEDVQIRLAEAGADGPASAQSSLGGGLLTFHTGYQFKTEGENVLWVRGPINRPVDGLYPLECIVDTSMLPCPITVHWIFTRPGHSVRFEQGEPFGALLPTPKNYVQTFEGEVVRLAGDPEAYERELEQMLQAPAVQSALQQLEAAGGQAASREQARDSQASLAAPGRAEPPTNLPAVSCICPTYGRVDLLEEAITSFLPQD